MGLGGDMCKQTLGIFIGKVFRSIMLSDWMQYYGWQCCGVLLWFSGFYLLMYINLWFQYFYCMGWSLIFFYVYEFCLLVKKMVDGCLDFWMVCERLMVCVCVLIWFFIQILFFILLICVSVELILSVHYCVFCCVCFDCIDYNLVLVIWCVWIKNLYRLFKVLC